MSLRHVMCAAVLGVVLAGCEMQDQLPPHARDALRNATAVQEVLDAESAPQVAAASCQMYTGWLQLDADARVALAKVLTEHIQRFTADANANTVRVIRLTSEFINSGTERHRELSDKLAAACSRLR